MDAFIGMIVCQVDVLQDSIMWQLGASSNTKESSCSWTRTPLLDLRRFWGINLVIKSYGEPFHDINSIFRRMISNDEHNSLGFRQKVIVPSYYNHGHKLNYNRDANSQLLIGLWKCNCFMPQVQVLEAIKHSIVHIP